MKLVENYLDEVASQLPQTDREDIIAELGSIIEAKMDDITERRGTEPNETQVASILKEMGHPNKVAAQYGAQQYLIGPGLFHPYKKVLKLTVIAVVTIQLLVALSSTMFTDGVRISAIGLMFDLASTALYTGFWVTVAFATMEYSGDKLDWFDKWEPLALSRAKRIAASREDANINVITDAVIFIWWNNWFGKNHDMPFTPNDFPVMATGVYDIVYWPINVLLITSLTFYTWQLVQCYWTKLRLQLAIIIDIASVIVLGYMIQAGDLFALKVTNENAAIILDKVNFSVSVVLAVIIGFVLYDIYGHLKNWRKLAS
ncbi:MAG: hypothetical protein GJ680_02730 [Alteromonadaceae bacterium]|nr:hypothetical protein [Alteromonadaceae bacterium]